MLYQWFAQIFFFTSMHLRKKCASHQKYTTARCTQKRNLLHMSFVLEFEWKKLDSKGIIYLSKMNFSISNSVILKMCKCNHSKHISKFKGNPKNMIKCWKYCTTSNSATNAQENEKEISNNLMSFYFLWKKAQT